LAGTRPPAAGSPGAAAPALQAPAVPVRVSEGSHAWLLVAQPLAALPLVQLVWLDLHAALASWSELAWLVGAFVTAMLGVTFGFGLRLARDQLRVEGLEARLQRSRKLEAIGQLAGGVAHDFNNVLAAVVGFGELAREDATAGSRQARHLDQVLQAADRGRQQVERILAFSRGQPRRQIVFLLQPLLQEVLDHLAPAAGTAVRIERDLRAPDLALRGDPGAVYEAVMNLCTNALQAMPDGGRLTGPLCACAGAGQRARHDAAGAGPLVRALLHHPQPRRRHRHRIGGGARRGAGHGGRRRRRQRAGAGQLLHAAAAGL
jgi:signal transduction histidine kinase